MRSQGILRFFILGLYTLLLIQLSTTLSISYFEYQIYSGESFSLLYYPLHLFTYLFGQNDMAIRGLMIVIHLATLGVFYEVSKAYVRKRKDQRLNLIVFVLLPGVVSAAVIVHDTGLVLLALLIFLWIHQKNETFAWITLPVYFFMDAAFFILFLALFIQMLMQKRYYHMSLALVLMVSSFYFFGFPTDLAPQNYFLSTFAILAIIFSPILFFYFLYTLLRVGIRGERDLIWLISLSALVVGFILSFRQKVPLEQFGPFIIIMLPVMMKLYLHTLRMRIKKLRKMHWSFFTLALVFLVANTMIMYFNKVLYIWQEDPQKHFLYEHHIAKDLALKLKDLDITNISVSDKILQKRLEFYGVKNVNPKYQLSENGCKNVTISYVNIPIVDFCVTKINK